MSILNNGPMRRNDAKKRGHKQAFWSCSYMQLISLVHNILAQVPGVGIGTRDSRFDF